MGCELFMRNPSRLFSTVHIPIAQCRGCLFKTLCLENEKNPVIRHLVLGEDIRDDVFDGEDTIEEIQTLLETEPNKVHFKLDIHSNLVDVYYNDSLLYKINRSLYSKLTNGDENDHTQAMRDCAK